MCSRDEVQFRHALVADHGLAQPAAAFDHIHQVVHDAVFETHDDIQVSQTDVAVDADDFLVQAGKCDGQIGGCSGLANPSLS